MATTIRHRNLSRPYSEDILVIKTADYRRSAGVNRSSGFGRAVMNVCQMPQCVIDIRNKYHGHAEVVLLSIILR